jgi:predicted ATP-grasp superfamily ATP-dependent carboligase
MNKTLIIITDPYQRKSFDLYNIIKRDFDLKNILIFSNQNKNLFNNIFLKFFYTNSIIDFQKGNDNKYDFIALAKKYLKYDLVYIPVEEETTIEFIKQLSSNDKFENNYKYLLPKPENYFLSRDKLDLNQWCEKKLIACPKNYTISEIKKDNYKLPLIIKPKHGSGSRGIHYIYKKEQLKEIKFLNNNYVIQEMIPNGKNVEACFALASKGEIKLAYTHQRIRTYPKSGGVSVFSKYTEKKELIDASKNLIKKLNFSGLIMIEYLLDKKTNTYKLIEINPRIWGSILLSEYSNKKFILNYINLSLNKSISKNTKSKDNIYLRWLIPYDIFNLFSRVPKNTIYINMTYATFFSSLAFHFIAYSKKILKL